MGVSLSLKKEINGFELDVEWAAGGGLTALFGFSGSGKTMTLQMIAGLMDPDQGRIEVNGRLFFDSRSGVSVKTRHRRVGYVFQDYALIPHMTVEQNIGFGLARGSRYTWSSGMSSSDVRERVSELIDQFSLSGIEKSYPREISGGQRQRVALARALIGHPEMLMLDEPFSALDLPVRRQAQAVIAEAREAFDVPVILVTHDFSEVRNLADEVIVYSAGRVVQTGTVENIVEDPAGELIKSLTGIG